MTTPNVSHADVLRRAAESIAAECAMTTPNAAERPALDLDAMLIVAESIARERAEFLIPGTYSTSDPRLVAIEFCRVTVPALVAELRETRRERDEAIEERDGYHAELTWIRVALDGESAGVGLAEQVALVVRCMKEAEAERAHLRAELDTAANLLGAEREPAAVTDDARDAARWRFVRDRLAVDSDCDGDDPSAPMFSFVFVSDEQISVPAGFYRDATHAVDAGIQAETDFPQAARRPATEAPNDA